MTRSLLLLASALALGPGCSPPPPPPRPAQTPVMNASPFMAPGVRRPTVRAAADAGLEDGARVVGVTTGGKARAYAVAALSPINRHVVNDVLGDVPVTVTYCDLCRAARVFTDPAEKDALPMSQGGRDTEGLLVMYGGVMYSQVTGKRSGLEGPPLPLKTLEHEETTWKAWRDKHPGTDVYTGS